MSDHERHEPQHEYNFFLDRQIQNKLLDIEEQEEEDLLQKKSLSRTNSVNVISLQGNTKMVKMGSGKELRSRILDDLTSWIPDAGIKLRKQEKLQKGPKERGQDQGPRWETWGTKECKSKEISFVFKHYLDWRLYIDQYKREHTYNYGPLGDMIIEPPRILQRADSVRYEQRLPSSYASTHNARVTSRTNSESNILELARKYKTGMNAPKSLHTSTVSTQSDQIKNTHCQEVSLKIESDSASVDSNSPKQLRTNGLSSAKSPPNLFSLKKYVPNTAEQRDLALTSTKIPVLPQGASTHLVTMVTRKPAFYESPGQQQLLTAMLPSKGMRLLPPHIPAFAVDGQTFRLTSNKSPTQLISSSIRTMDVLSNVAAVDRQVWFDSSGRAFVSLATRYDPVRK